MPRDASQFGRLLKAWRLSRGYGQRQFAQLIGEYPSNLAAIEMGSRNPWTDKEKLRKVAGQLALSEGSQEWHEFFSYALDTKPIVDLDTTLDRDEVLVLLRTVQERKLTSQQVLKLTEYAKKLQGEADGTAAD